MGPSKRKGSVRRQVLDLNAREDSPSRPTWQTKYQHALPGEGVYQNGDSQTTSPSVPINNPLTGLLGNYNSDSDNEEPVQKPASNLDAKVEDFLKEIQSISAESSNSAQTETNIQQLKQKDEVQYSSVTAWQQCYDHNSGYPYYWNIETNEVTWEMPAELKTAITSVAVKQHQQTSQSKTDENKKVCKYPWQTESDSEDEKIEMITSFGPQSGEESEEEEDKSLEKSKKNVNPIGPNLPIKSLSSYISSTKIRSDISPAPEDPEGMNESSYETSSLLAHGVQDTGPPGDDSFQANEETVKINKVPASSVKEECTVIQTKTDCLKYEVSNDVSVENENSLVQIKPVESVSTEPQEKSKCEEETDIENKSSSENINIADDVIAQIEKETPPDYKDSSKLENFIESQKHESVGSQISPKKTKTSGFALIANYGDDSESEDNSYSEKRKNSSKSIMNSSKPVFPIEIPEDKVKPLFPCMATETPNTSVELCSRLPSHNENEPVSNIYSTELDVSDPSALKAFKRKKRIEFATTVYGPSTSKGSDQVVSVPTTQYNLDPNSNDHPGFGFNALRAQPDSEKKSYKYGGIQFIKAETINLRTDHDSKEKPETETETDNTGASRNNSKEPVRNEEVEDAATLLREKVTFLTGGKGEISPIQQMAIELETLVLAWQNGALTPPYLLRWLNEKCAELIRHEKTAAPPGWTCLWDRKSKRYFYRNTTTKAIQWEYPNVEEKAKTKEGDVEGCGDEMDICDTPPHLSPAEPEKQTDEPPSTPPPPVISDVAQNVSPQSPTPQPPPPPQISFCPDSDSSSVIVSKKKKKTKKRKADEITINSEGETDSCSVPVPNATVPYEPSCEELETVPPLPPMPPPPPPPPDESPPPLPNSPPPLPLDPDQPLPPGVDEPEYSLYRASKHSYKKAQNDSAAYSAELMMTYGYGLPVQQVVSPGTQAMAVQMQSMEYHTYMHEPVSNHYLVQSAPTSHVIHCPAKKPKPSLTSELVSFYSDLAMLDSSPAESKPISGSQSLSYTPAPTQDLAPASGETDASASLSTSSIVPSVTVKSTDGVTSNGVNVKKKKKAKATSGLSLKKKGVSTLVAKWQQVQQEVRRDFSDDDDDDDVPAAK